MPLKKDIAVKKPKKSKADKQAEEAAAIVPDKPHSNQRVPDNAIIAALKRTQGLISLAADVLTASGYKISHSGLSKRVRKSEKLKQVMEECTEELLDIAEATLLTKIKNGNVSAIIFYLKCKGKGRGYNDRHEITGADGGAIQVEQTWAERIADYERRRAAENQ